MRTTRDFVSSIIVLLAFGYPVLGDGACCLPDVSCVPAVDAADCALQGGVFLLDADCADAPCFQGACCFETSCAQSDAYACIAGGREFAGAGVSCLDDPCAAGVGACCFGATCVDLSTETCGAKGGTWLGPGTSCDTNPCELGACCLPGNTCDDTTAHACQSAGGTHAPGLICDDEPDPCAGDDLCPADTLFGQPPDTPDDFVAGSSEASAGFERFEDFDGVAGAIDAITFWGLDLEFVGASFIECDEPDPTFQISFHEDAAGVPGAMVCTYELTATRTPLGILYKGAGLNEYTVTLPEPCVLVRGWVSIVGLGDPDCWFLWMSAGLFGDSYCNGCLPPPQDIDLALCLQGRTGGVSGTCCDDADGTCQDAIDIADCVQPTQRFQPGVSCADLDPPCGIVLGACCFPDATCTIELQGPCEDIGATWLGDGSLCDQCPCLAPCIPGGTQEGEAVCEDGFVDLFNGGCNAADPVFSAIDLDTTICGTSGIFQGADGPEPDLDWYSFDIGTDTTLRVTVRAEFRPRVVILDAADGCPGVTIANVDALECDVVDLALSGKSGTYWLVVFPDTFNDSSACGARYTARVTTSACLADVDDDDIVGFNDLLAVLSTWGPCPAPCPTDIDGDGVVDFGDLLALLSEWGAACSPD